MKMRLLLPVVLLATVACSRDPAPAAGPESSAQTEVPASAAPVAPVGVYLPFPEGVDLATPFHLRADRIYTTKAGAERRRATLEILEGEAAAAAAALGAQLEQNGFRALKIDDRGDGVTRLGFSKKGVGRINVTGSPDIGAKPANPRALGVVAIDWPLAGATATGQNDTAPSAADAAPSAR